MTEIIKMRRAGRFIQLCSFLVIFMLFVPACGHSKSLPDFWEMTGIQPATISSVTFTYYNNPVELSEEWKTQFIERLSSAEKVEIEDSHVFDKSEYEVCFHVGDRLIPVSFSFFSGRMELAAFENEKDHPYDNRMDVTLDGKTYYHFRFSSIEDVWDEYDSRFAYDGSAKAANKPQRGELDGFYHWSDAGMLQYKIIPGLTWEEIVSESEFIAIVQYCSEAIYPLWGIDPESFIPCSVLRIERILKGENETDYLYLPSSISPGKQAPILTDGEERALFPHVVNGKIPGVSQPGQYVKGERYLFILEEKTEDSAMQNSFGRAYIIDGGRLYATYNTELELFNGMPLDIVEEYLESSS